MSNYINIRESDKLKTFFISREGTFEFHKMPFGLKIWPLAFQHDHEQNTYRFTLKNFDIYMDGILK